MNTFFIRTLISLGVQLLITSVTTQQYRGKKITHKWIYFLLNMMFAFIMYRTSVQIHIRYGLLIAFSVFNGYILSGIFNKINEESIQTTVTYTLCVFVLMVSIASWLGAQCLDIAPVFYFIALYASVMFICMSYIMFFETQHKHLRIYRCITVGLCCAYIVSNTYMNLNKSYDNDIVLSTIDYYFDIFGIFKNISTTTPPDWLKQYFELQFVHRFA